MIVIGEKINGTRGRVARAIEERNSEFFEGLALEQVNCGADFLDINAGTHPDREQEDMTWLVNTVQKVTDATLSVDSANPKALLAGIEAAKSLPMINSLSGERSRVEGVLPLACRYNTELVVLALDDNGIPQTAEQRLDIIRRLVKLTRKSGLDDHKLYIDPLVTTIATDNNSGLLVFETIRRIKQEFPEVHITCGLSNISFGQPSRSIINQAFAPLAIGAGLDSAIMDPCDEGLRGIIYAAEMVLGMDPDCLGYAQAHRQGLVGTAPGISPQHLESIGHSASKLLAALTQAGLLAAGKPAAAPVAAAAADAERHLDQRPDGQEGVLEQLVSNLVNMKRDQVAELSDQLLNSGADPMAILDASRRGMAEVGRLFEQGEYFVPELILAGRMLATISEKVKPHLVRGKSTAKKKGRVMIGTVEGDIHDIGKNIVVTMLDISGYEVLDLGVDVPKEKFLEAAKEFRPQVIGLSGFLTLAYEPIKDTIAALKQEDLGDVKFMIGGGQIDEQVRLYTQADAVGKDAVEAVRLCNQWIGQ